MRKYELTAVALYDPDFPRMTAALQRLTQHGKTRWTIARVDGGSVLFTQSQARFDPARLAYGPPNPNELPQAGNGPAVLLEADPWRWLEPQRGRIGSWEADAATVYLRLYEEQSPDGRSPALPLLAVRAARVGIEMDSHDATAWLMLARAYERLAGDREEQSAAAALTPLAALRQVQIATALVQAVLLNPDLAPRTSSWPPRISAVRASTWRFGT